MTNKRATLVRSEAERFSRGWLARRGARASPGGPRGATRKTVAATAAQAQRATSTQRRRRSPEVARQELLDAAERVFAQHPPDDVGLKEIAREAGTSHALITHYFGTYGGLVEAVLQRRLLRLRETIAARLRRSRRAVAAGRAARRSLFRTLDDPVHLRLMKWVIASDRQESLHVFALQHHGVHADRAAGRGDDRAAPITGDARRELVEKIELSLVTARRGGAGLRADEGRARRDASVDAPSPALDDGVRTRSPRCSRRTCAKPSASPMACSRPIATSTRCGSPPRSTTRRRSPGHDLPYLVHVVSVAAEVIAALPTTKLANPDLAVTVRAAPRHGRGHGDHARRDRARSSAPPSPPACRRCRRTTRCPKQEQMADSLRRIREQPPRDRGREARRSDHEPVGAAALLDAGEAREYRDEAIVIADALGDASATLDARLRARIEGYKSFC